MAVVSADLQVLLTHRGSPPKKIIKSGLCNHPGKVKKECEDPQELGRAWVNPFSVAGGHFLVCVLPGAGLCFGRVQRGWAGSIPKLQEPILLPPGQTTGKEGEKEPGPNKLRREERGKKRLPNAASLRSQQGKGCPETQQRGSERAEREKSRKPRAVSLPGNPLKPLKIKALDALTWPGRCRAGGRCRSCTWPR